MTVWVVSLEWNQAPSDVTGDTGIVGVYATEAAADAARRAEQERLHAADEQVYGYSTGEDCYCPRCGVRWGTGAHRERDCNPDGEETYCSECGDELGAEGCDREHDEWTIDVHCTEMIVQGAEEKQA